MRKVERRIYYVFSPWLRIFHWTMVVCICVLFATGLMIAEPWVIYAPEPTFSGLTIDNIRNIHFIAAFVLTAAFIFRIYGFIINRGDRLFPRVWEGQFYSTFVSVALHYMFLRARHASFLRNPMARASYALLYLLVLLEAFTGFAMYGMNDPSGICATLFGWVLVVMNGEYMVHIVHHYAAWAIILFAIGHVYMVVRAEFMEGESEVSSMFSGSKILVHKPLDVGEIEPPTTK